MADIVMIPIEHLYPHPDNPRKDLGDLSELAGSIRAKGVLQNLTVVPSSRARQAGFTPPDGTYTIIIGHRRHAAAKIAGLTELPCVIVDMGARDQVQTMLIENMQRSDLTKYEEAHGFQLMLDMGSPVEEIAEKTGFSETTVRRRLKWMELDQTKFKQVTEDRQISITDLDRLSQIEDLAARNECLDKIGTNDFNMAVQKAVKHQLIDENMPKVKAWLKSVKAKQIKDSDRWSSSYDRVGSTIYTEKWGEDGNKPASDAESKPLFYYLGKKDSYDYGQLQLYHEHEKAKPVKRPKEEIEREKAIGAAWDRLESLGKTAFELRKKFIDGFTVTKKNEPQVIFGAVLAGCYNAIGYNSADRTSPYNLAGITDTGYIPDREEKFFEGFDKISGDEWAKLVYAMFGDADISCSSGYRREFPKFDHNRKLELIYRWLSTLGYKMSTEEAQLLSGDHEAYNAGENYGKV